MNKYSLNGIYGEEAEEVIINILNGGNSLCDSLIQTNIEMKGYFITNPELRRTLRKMENNNKIIRIDSNYKLNPAPIGAAN